MFIQCSTNFDTGLQLLDFYYRSLLNHSMPSQYTALSQFLLDAQTLTVLSGAGVSTASGIPDYRDRNGDSKVKAPIQFQEFVSHAQYRQRYWARSFVGYQRFSQAVPNPAHYALADLESTGKLDTLITQNVDGLHRRAGSQRVVDLHGDLAAVRCLGCGAQNSRSAYQDRLQDANPDWHGRVFRYRPDGDADLAEADLDHFSVPECDHCGGIVKPDVVMFGETVPADRVATASSAVDRADALLIVGSSLMVFSGFRFARQAAARGTPIAIVNRGRTRADDLAALRIDADCAVVLAGAIAAVAGTSCCL